MPEERIPVHEPHSADGWEPLRSFETIDLCRSGAAARIVLRRPETLNSWDDRLPVELLGALDAVESDPSLRALLITGNGRAFSSGADVNSTFKEGSISVGQSLRQVTNPIILRIRHMPKPVVAGVNGPAAGIGCSLALACDLVIAADSAYFLLPFTRLGLTLDGGSSLMVSARIGHARASRLALLAERLGAVQAAEWGLIDQVVPAADHATEAEALVQRLAAGPTRAYAATKRALHAAVYSRLEEQLDLEAQLQDELAASADFDEGVTAYQEKRQPAFVGA
jgi:enoyl-CoA hydratase/carnithine racemase